MLQKDKIWWDDLGVFLGVPRHTVRDANIVEFMAPVPFGFLHEGLEMTGCNIQIAVQHDWNALYHNHLLHTDVSEFADYCIMQELDLREGEGIFSDFDLEEWGVPLDELKRQLITEPYNKQRYTCFCLIYCLTFWNQKLIESINLCAV